MMTSTGLSRFLLPPCRSVPEQGAAALLVAGLLLPPHKQQKKPHIFPRLLFQKGRRLSGSILKCKTESLPKIPGQWQAGIFMLVVRKYCTWKRKKCVIACMHYIKSTKVSQKPEKLEICSFWEPQ